MRTPYHERVIRFCTGFFENSAKQSMTRWVVWLLAFGALGLVAAVYKVATRSSLNDAALTITAIGGCLATIVTGIFGALKARTKSTDLAEVEIPPAPITEVKP